LLSGNGFIVSDIHLNNMKMGQMIGSMCIMARAKNSPTDEVDFGLWGMPKSIFTTNDLHKPFIASLPLAGFSPDKLKELQK
jgi:hypothetical protein